MTAANPAAPAAAPELDPALNHYALARIRLDLGAGNAIEVELPAGARIVHSYVALEARTRS